MSLLSDLAERLRALLFRGRHERELAEEVRFHIEREVAERIREGAEPAVARREALLAFGGVELYKEQVRDARGVRPLEDLGSDIRYAIRALRQNPVFTSAVVLVLGLGLAATTTVFTVADAVLLSELPYPQADRLVRVYERNSVINLWNISTVDYQAIRDQQRSFDGFGAVSRTDAALSGTRPNAFDGGREAHGERHAQPSPLA